MITKVLIVSKSETFISYTKQLIAATRNDIRVISAAHRLIDAERYYMEYLHSLIIFDAEGVSALMDKTIKKIKDYNGNNILICVDKELNISLMRLLFRSGLSDYISIDEFDNHYLKMLFDNSSSEDNFTKELDDEIMMEQQLGLLRDEQSYDRKFVQSYLDKMNFDTESHYRLIFFRIDNIAWVYHHVIKDRLEFQRQLRTLLEESLPEETKLIFSKKHSGFILCKEFKSDDLLKIQSKVNKLFNFDISFIILKEDYHADRFIDQYKIALELLDLMFYLDNRIILDENLVIYKNNDIKNFQNNYAIDIEYRFRKKDFLNADYFVTQSLDFMEKNRIRRGDVVSFYSTLYQKVALEQFNFDQSIEFELKELIRNLYLVNKFDSLRSTVIGIHETIKNKLEKRAQGSHNPYINRIEEYIRQNIDQKITLKELSDALGITEIYISRLYKEEAGINLFTFINAIKMERAAQLLGSNTENVKDIAQMVGFDDSLYFSRVFKKHYGVSPSKYKHVRR